MKNVIVNDFGDEGLEIDISTKTFKDHTILIDRDIYDSIDFHVRRQGPREVVFRDSKGKLQYLQRYITKPEGRLRVIHKDGLYVDFRRCNLLLVDRQHIPRKLNKTLRDVYKEVILRLGQEQPYVLEKPIDDFFRCLTKEALKALEDEECIKN